MGEKAVGGGVGAVIGSVVAQLRVITPDSIERLLLASLLLLLADFVTGVAVAAYYRRVSSHEARRRTLAKCAQYFGLVSLGAAAALLTGQWVYLAAGWGCVSAIEALSVLENLVRLQAAGVKLGPIAPALTALGKVFAVAALPPSIGTTPDSGPVDGAQETQLPR